MKKVDIETDLGFVADDSVKDCLRQIHKLPNVTKVVIYGSYAKGTNRDDSDLDLAVFFNLPEEKMHTCYRKLAHICNIENMDIQVQAFSDKELTDPCGIIEEIVSFGIEII